MKEPDLIYVAIDTPIEKRRDHKFVGLAWTKNDNSCEHIEYIRKDALIELLKPEKDISFPDDYERGCIDGRNGLRGELIDKLNSM